jgi:hypothetical protein
MKPQLWSGTEKPMRNKMTKVNPTDIYFGKPTGGLWTSPLRNGSSPWLDYAHSVNLTNIKKENQWVLIPKPDANVLEIENKKDLMKVSQKTTEFGQKTLDYEPIFQTYDGVYVKKSMVNRGPFYEWDCESILWNKWVFDNCISLNEYI